MKAKLLYFHAGKSSFVNKDIEILHEKYTVLDFFFDTTNKKKYFSLFAKQVAFILTNIFGSKLFVCQFAGHHAFLPILFSKIFFKRSVIVAGGTDCVSFPSIGYGNFNNKLLTRTTAFSFKKCDLILPVHQTLVEYDYTYQNNDFKKQGYQFFIPNIKTHYQIIHNGYDSKKWFCDTEKEKNSFVTIGAGLDSRFGFNLKGIDLILEIASQFPHCTFYIVGGLGIDKQTTANVKLLDKIPNNELRQFISNKQFYMQLSMSEGFPNALSEGMLCECVPIVSNVGGMPDIVKDCGYILKHKNISELYELVNGALNNFDLDKLGKKARKRVVENYTFEKRKEQLLLAVNKLI
ncbi:MAG: glycosyltransferase family 4 protein [Burkholderiales bacterium]|nr:glycosyltransferase family 4 protein [Bacteroidia bacterium]